MNKKRYAVVGVSNRAYTMFMDPLLYTYNSYADFVAMLDPDIERMKAFNKSRNVNIPQYSPEQFEQMVKQTKPDAIIIACQDYLHHEYIILALKQGLEVISEKPLTTDVEKCAEILEIQTKTKGKITVTFNCRYTPQATKIKEIISDGKVGRVISVDLNWYLDTYHGSSYFQRWNRIREFSGGLNIHKSCHHLDLIHWWIDQKPVEVFAYGKLNFYGPKGIHNPLTPEQIGDGRTCDNCDMRSNCKYFMRWYRNQIRISPDITQTSEPQKAGDGNQKYQSYSKSSCIFDPQINIEDTYSAVIKYDNGAFLNYSLNGSLPYEGFSVAINGTEGRIEYKEIHASERAPFRLEPGAPPVAYFPLFGGRETIDIINQGGDHGGGDPLLLDDLFLPFYVPRKVNPQANLIDGISAVLTGEAIHQSIVKNAPVQLAELWEKVLQNKIKNVAAAF